MKKILISIFLCLPLLLCAQSGPAVNITGSYTAVLYDPYTPPITADLDNHIYLSLNGTPRSVTIRVLLKKDTGPNYVVNDRSFTFTTYRYP